jgi:hypothetical protein
VLLVVFSVDDRTSISSDTQSVSFDRCASCGAPSSGSYRCAVCTVAAELADDGTDGSPLASRSSKGGKVRPSVWISPTASLVDGLRRAADSGLIPSWLPKALLIFVLAWIVFLFIWGFAA